MKWTFFLSVIALFSCHQSEEKLSEAEIAQIKSDIIKRSEKHANDLENLDYKAVMTFYAPVDFIVFGDGYYWGDYLTIDGVWKEILGEGGWKKMLKWDLQNHQVHVISKTAASYLVEFDHAHLDGNSDTIRSSGCFTYGMQKIGGEWKAVTAHVSHIPFRTEDDKWWSKYSPENRLREK
ncbi:MAG: nuclear transport factor 2 family protein [Saprospiraceae bacterium]|nr:nuclear transport factor 2 family protein [Saprospiraceae bacterium]